MQRSACIFGCSGKRLSKRERDFFEHVKPLGFILFSRNADLKEDVRELVCELRGVAGEDVLILTDHEGGRVQRFTGPGWRHWLPALAQCDRIGPPDRLRALWLRYRIIAEELHSVGIDVNCVPLGDVATAATHPVLFNRCYARDPESVALAAAEVAAACRAGGVAPVLKHIPGHGRVGGDSHLELPHTDVAAEELERTDFVPFRKLRHLPLGMTAHVLYRSIDDALPATQSKAMVTAIRENIGFDGLLMTDDLSMQALTGSMAQRSRLSIEAGCDVALHCSGKLAEMEQVADAAGKLAGMAKARADRSMAVRGRRTECDPAELDSELRGILRRAGI